MSTRFPHTTFQRILIVVCLVGLALAVAVSMYRGLQNSVLPRPAQTITFADDDRILVMAPHPDDEVLGCGGIIINAVKRHIPVRIVFLTYGDCNEWSFVLDRKHPVIEPTAVRKMAETRHDEAVAAAQEMGLSSTNLVFLGYPDGGTMKLWLDHWGNEKPYQSALTRVDAVPYQNAFRPGAAYRGDEVIRDLRSIVESFRPTKVFVSHPADFHLDHRALYLFTRVALWEECDGCQPTICPYPTHFKSWPGSRGLHRDNPLIPPRRLTGVTWWQYPLDEATVQRKMVALDQHATQIRSAGRYLRSFVRTNELFGDFTSITVTPQRVTDTAVMSSSSELIADLSAQQRARIVGIEQRQISIDNEQLSVVLTFSRPVAKLTGSSLFIFGYRSDRPFVDMPKLHIKLGSSQPRVWDRGRRLPSDTVAVERDTRKISVRIPLVAAGSPEKIFIGSRTYVGALPVDRPAWRILVLQPGKVGEGERPAVVSPNDEDEGDSS